MELGTEGIPIDGKEAIRRSLVEIIESEGRTPAVQGSVSRMHLSRHDRHDVRLKLTAFESSWLPGKSLQENFGLTMQHKQLTFPDLFVETKTTKLTSRQNFNETFQDFRKFPRLCIWK